MCGHRRLTLCRRAVSKPRFHVGDRVRWCLQVAPGLSTTGVTGHKWGTVSKVEPTGLPPTQMPTGLEVEAFLYHVKWDDMDLNEVAHPLLGYMLEAKSAVERLGEITDE